MNREEILNGGYLFPDHYIGLKFTPHFLQRVKERRLNWEDIPEQVRITKSNLYAGSSNENHKLTNAVITLTTHPEKLVFLCFNPYQGTAITVWTKVRKRKKKDGNRKKVSICRVSHRQTVRHDRREDKIQRYSRGWKYTDWEKESEMV